MLIKIFLKEWRENILVFVLSIFLLLALVVLNFSGQKELTMYFAGMFLWLFLPFAALLIGSSGYYSEFKDNAWIFMFSRPVKKWQFWFVKFLALLSIFMVVFLIFYALIQFLPGLKDILQESGLLYMMEQLLSYSPYLIVSLLALSISYSISFMSEKQFVLVFVSILIGLGLVFLVWRYFEFVMMTYFRDNGVEGLAVLFGLSFLAASLLTFIKCDFSQMRKKIFTFTQFVALFLVISFVCHLAWITKGKFTPRTWIPSYYWHKVEGSVYLYSFQDGILKFDTQADEMLTLNRTSRFSFSRYSVGGGKVAFIKETQKARQSYTNLWVMNADGTEPEAEIETHKEDSPLFNMHISSCLVTDDGRRVAFVVEPERRKQNKHSLWRMLSDGTRLEELELDLPRHREFQLLYWSDLDNSIILAASEKSREVLPNLKIIKIDLETGTHRVLAEHVLNTYHIPVSPRGDFIAIRYRQLEAGTDHFALVNTHTNELRDVSDVEGMHGMGMKWNNDGEKILFWKKATEYELWVYDLSMDKTNKIVLGLISPAYYHCDWLVNDNLIILADLDQGKSRLRILDENLNELRSIGLPEEIENPREVWGLENAILVQRSWRGGFWRLDLATEKWKKVF